jgi:hypothetical protein
MELNQSTKMMLEALDKSEKSIKKIGDLLVQAALERGVDKDNISSVGGAVSMTFAHMIADICGIPESKVFTMAATPAIAVVAAPYIRELLAHVEVDEIEKSELGED